MELPSTVAIKKFLDIPDCVGIKFVIDIEFCGSRYLPTTCFVVPALLLNLLMLLIKKGKLIKKSGGGEIKTYLERPQVVVVTTRCQCCSKRVQVKEHVGTSNA